MKGVRGKNVIHMQELKRYISQDLFLKHLENKLQTMKMTRGTTMKELVVTNIYIITCGIDIK